MWIACATGFILAHPFLQKNKGLSVAISGTILFGTVGLYALIGAPELSRSDNIVPMGPEPQEAPSLEALVARLETRLNDSPGDEQGWLLLARSRMTLGTYDKALEAYDHLVELTNNADVMAERQQALDFIQTQGAPYRPTQADVDTATQMSDADDQ